MRAALHTLILVFVTAFTLHAADYKSIEAMHRSCDNNTSGIDCLMLSIYYKDGHGEITPDINKSVSYLHKACSLNVPVACYNLGNYYAKVKKDRIKAMTLYDRACKRKIENACYNYHILQGE